MSEQPEPLDLVIDLNTMDETGLRWAFLKQPFDPSRFAPGSHIVVGVGAGDIDSATYEQRLLDLVTAHPEPQTRTA